MADLRDDCARCRSLLARMDDVATHARAGDPSSALDAHDLAWLAAHIDACAACGAEHAFVASLGALREEVAELPGEEFFAERRAALLDAIRAADDGGVVGAGAPAGRDRSDPARGATAATRPALRALPGNAARDARGPRPLRRRSVWRPLLPALAAGLAIVAVLGALRARAPQRDAAEVAVLEQVPSGDDLAALAAESADDSWVIASSDPFALALSSTAGPALDELSDEDLDEIEAVFVPSPGWS
jgi:hypothetical protein